MRSILPSSLLAATMLSLFACESQEDPGAEAAAQQNAEASAPDDVNASQHDVEAPQHDAGASQRDADTEDAARGEDGEAAAPSLPPDAGAPKPTLEELMQEYRAWSPHPSEPQAISDEISGLCRLPSAAEDAFVASEHGRYRWLQNWLNPAAKRAFDDKRTPFEVGAAIVKEKLVLETGGQRRLVARGLMIKRASGFDPAHGDWEFGYWEPGMELRSGDEAARTCGACHASADTDFVFLDGRWRFPL
jgi:hypothetical protein